MKLNDIIIIEHKKKSPIKTILKVVSATAVIAGGAVIAYKYLQNKIESSILGKLDLDGDGEAETIILDTTGDGEIDTIVINSETFGEE